jgi:hypothetical protein
VVKTEDEEVPIADVPDFSVFKLETILPEPVCLTIRQEGSIYFKLVEAGNENKKGDDVLGLAVVNPK